MFASPNELLCTMNASMQSEFGKSLFIQGSITGFETGFNLTWLKVVKAEGSLELSFTETNQLNKETNEEETERLVEVSSLTIAASVQAEFEMLTLGATSTFHCERDCQCFPMSS